MTIEPSHEGYDPTGSPTTHTGPLENCPAIECQDRIQARCEGCGEPLNNGKPHGYWGEYGGCI